MGCLNSKSRTVYPEKAETGSLKRDGFGKFQAGGNPASAKSDGKVRKVRHDHVSIHMLEID
jgi:hypothetical protein